MVMLYGTGDMILIAPFFFYFLLFGDILISPDLVSLLEGTEIMLESGFLYVSFYLIFGRGYGLSTKICCTIIKF